MVFPCWTRADQGRWEWVTKMAVPVEAIKEIEAKVGQPASRLQREFPAPRELFHYTSVDAFVSIVEKQELWVSHYRYMNDTKELEYGSAICRSVALERIGAIGGKLSERICNLIPTAIVHTHMMEYYILSFCEVGDLLNQWRLYSESGSGVSIGFFSRRLPGTTILKCLYEEAQQRTMASEVVDSFVPIIRDYERACTDEDNLVHIAATFLRLLTAATVEMAVTFKHSAFSEEREWRAIIGLFRHEGMTQIRYRVGRFGLMPYISISPRATAGTLTGRLPLSSIALGPSRFGFEQREAVEGFLRKCGYHHLAVTVPDISYRT